MKRMVCFGSGLLVLGVLWARQRKGRRAALQQLIRRTVVDSLKDRSFRKAIAQSVSEQ
jgi:hypothetical protein